MRARALVTTACLLAATGWADPATGKKLNAEGYELYKQQDYKGALRKFTEAVAAAPRLAIARYNRAATMSRIGNPCEVTGAEILSELKASIELDPSRLARAKLDPDFAYVRTTVGFQRLLGADFRTVQGLTRALPSVRWRHPTDCGTDMGCGSLMTFLKDGKLRREDRANDLEGAWRVREGRWRVEQRAVDAGPAAPQIVIDVKAEFGLPAIHDVGQVLEDGRLVFDSVWWTDDPELCA